MPRIETDLNRFRQIVRGKVRDELRKHLGQQEMFGRRGRDIVSIPVPTLDLPHFVHDPGRQGVGQGEGDGGSGAGDQPGQHVLEAEFSVDELAELLGEALELPRIEPRGNSEVETSHARYSGVAPVGPESLRHFKRSYRKALKRMIASGTYDPNHPRVTVIPRDRMYRTAKTISTPRTNAAIVYVMDVSGSMGAEQKELVRLNSFWLDAWIRKHYPGMQTVYIVHDAAAKEVDRDTFFRIRESGGTVISSAYDLALKVIRERFPRHEWNLYLFHFSDGENYSRQDTNKCLEMLKDAILPQLNLFGYGQVESYGTSGDFYDALIGRFKEDERVAMSRIPNRNAVADTIQRFLGKGR